MSAYADSSFLLKLYIKEPETVAAWQAVNSRQGELSFTNLLRLEMTNDIRRCAASRKITKSQAALIYTAFFTCVSVCNGSRSIAGPCG